MAKALVTSRYKVVTDLSTPFGLFATRHFPVFMGNLLANTMLAYTQDQLPT